MRGVRYQPTASPRDSWEGTGISKEAIEQMGVVEVQKDIALQVLAPQAGGKSENPPKTQSK